MADDPSILLRQGIVGVCSIYWRGKPRPQAWRWCAECRSFMPQSIGGHCVDCSVDPIALRRAFWRLRRVEPGEEEPAPMPERIGHQNNRGRAGRKASNGITPRQAQARALIAEGRTLAQAGEIMGVKSNCVWALLQAAKRFEERTVAAGGKG